MNIHAKIILSAALLLGAFYAHAETAAELQAKIDSRNKEIAALEKEIAEYQEKLLKTYNEGQTLKSAIAALDLNRKKLQTDINLTQKKIDTTTLEIESLGRQIGDKEERIADQREALFQSIRDVHEAEEQSLVESLFTYDDLGDLWNSMAAIAQIQGGINDHLTELRDIKETLTDTKAVTEKKKAELTEYRRRLSDQKKIIEVNKKEKDLLLKQTKNQEANYRNLLAEKNARRDAFETELFNYESQLKLIIDPSSFPRAGSGILSWPVDSVFVTQRFGNTTFALNNPQAYNGRGHNGIDLRASEGTPLKAALSGVVVGIGNTDTVCPGASYGQWVLIRHDNGLSTLYAHLSLIRVNAGQTVATREIIGYSGSTGYATGPHLHFAVYASQGVEITSRKSKVCGGNYRMPVADFKAYLNPLSYL